jgi:hypothetical protein
VSLEDKAHVYETLLGKAYAAVRLVDGTTGEPLSTVLELRDLAACTPDASHDRLPLPSVVNKAGLLGFFYPDDVSVHPKLAPAQALDQPSSHVAAELSGTLVDPSRRYNPTAFAVSLSAVAPGFTPAEIKIFRTPFGTPITRTGAVHGTLRYDQPTPPPPVPFGRVALTFTVTRRLSGPPRTIVIEAETDPAGDFVLPLDRLPALTGSETSRSGKLTVRVPPRGVTVAASGAVPLRAATVGAAGSTTVSQLSLDVSPGVVLRVPKLPAKHLVAVPT